METCITALRRNLFYRINNFLDTSDDDALNAANFEALYRDEFHHIFLSFNVIGAQTIRMLGLAMKHHIMVCGRDLSMIERLLDLHCRYIESKYTTDDYIAMI